MLPLVKFNKGFYVDGARIDTVTDFKANSSINNISEVTVSFLCKIDGLDNILPTSFYTFKKQDIAEYKPHRKFNSR